MADELRVDTGVLRAGGERLVACGAVVGDLDGGHLAARRGRYGSAALECAAEALAERWALGVRALAGDVGDAGRGLVSVAQSFEAVDAVAATAARDVSAPR
jgi:hypothetical protein